MGTCGNEDNRSKKTNSLNEKKSEGLIPGNQSNNSNLQRLDSLAEQEFNSVCALMKNKKIIGNGFFCLIPFPDKFSPISVLITCNHILNDDSIKEGSDIKLLFNDKISKTIKMNEPRKIYTSNENEYDITMIEIKEKDGFTMNNDLMIDYDIYKKDGISQLYKNLPIYIYANPHLPNSKKSNYSNGKIKSIDNKNFKIEHSCTIEEDASGAPIINSKNSKIIGVHIGKNPIKLANRGILLKKPIEKFNELYNQNYGINQKNEINTEIIEQKDFGENNHLIENNNILNENIKNNLKSSRNEIFEELNTSKNEIKLIAEIKRDDLNKNIYFFGILNELNQYNTKILINNEEISFRKYFTPNMEGLYDIKIIININMKDCSHMFSNCNKLTNIDLSNFYTENIIDMSYMFSGCSKLKNIDLSTIDTKNVTNMSFMFKDCSNLININLSSLDTHNVNYMIGMFSDCSKLANIDLSSLNTKNVIYMNYMFCRCSNLSNINFNSFSTENVTNMMYMFNGCYNLTSINLSNLDTKNVTNMIGLFSDCYNLTNIDLSPLGTQNVTNMSYMFSGCSKITNIDLSFLNIQKVTNMSYMFNGCSQLTNIDLSSLDTKNLNNMKYMFSECLNLNTIKVKKGSFDKKKSKLNSNVKIIVN